MALEKAQNTRSSRLCAVAAAARGGRTTCCGRRCDPTRCDGSLDEIIHHLHGGRRDEGLEDLIHKTNEYQLMGWCTM